MPRYFAFGSNMNAERMHERLGWSAKRFAEKALDYAIRARRRAEASSSRRRRPAARAAASTAPIASATSVAQIDELAGSIGLELTEVQLERLTNAGA